MIQINTASPARRSIVRWPLLAAPERLDRFLSSRVKQRYLEDLRELSRHMPLEHAVHVVCRPFATLTSIDIARDGDKGYVCFVTPASSEERAALLSKVGGFLFGEGLCFFLPWPPDEDTRRRSGE